MLCAELWRVLMSSSGINLIVGTRGRYVCVCTGLVSVIVSGGMVAAVVCFLATTLGRTGHTVAGVFPAGHMVPNNFKCTLCGVCCYSPNSSILNWNRAL